MKSFKQVRDVRVIAFDADDTLWHNERIFARTEARFRRLLSRYQDEEYIEHRLNQMERRNLQFFGYGIKGFTLSMIETALELTEGRIKADEILRIIGFAKEMASEPVQLLEGVEPALARLSGSHSLMLITKGDLFDQETKIAASGLEKYFEHIEIVTEKNESVYRKILEAQALAPSHFAMVGNSLRSDIFPVLEIGAHAVYIPYPTTWVHEQVEAPPQEQRRYLELDHISLLPALFNGGLSG